MMKFMKKFAQFVPALAIVLSLAAVAMPAQPAHACFLGFGDDCSSTGSSSDTSTKCGDTKTQLISCSDDTGMGTIGDLIKFTVIVLTILIGIVATGGIAYGAILYATARDNQSQLDQSKTIIRNVIIGLVLYGFTIVIVNWLIPGGAIGAPTPSPSPSVSPDSSLSPSPSSTPVQ